MKTMLTCLAVLFVSVTNAGAQASPRAASAGDSMLIRENIYRELFAGITVSPEQKARAQQVIAVAERKGSRVLPFHNCDERQVLVDLVARRDSTLLAMMTNSADSAMFAKHAESFVMGPCPFPKK